MRSYISRNKQRGVAVVTALLLTTLAITIVASLFWQQQVQIRSIENQRLQLQKQSILRGALDYASLILRTDAATSANVDHLGEAWATPLAETNLSLFNEGSSDPDAKDATLSGGIVDAQGRFNLNNLVAPTGEIDANELATLQNLLTELRLSPNLARTIAAAVKDSRPKPVAINAGAGQSANPLEIQYIDDLQSVPGITPPILDKLKDFVIVLPLQAGKTLININTAPVEILAAKLPTLGTLSKADAARVVTLRQQAYFRDAADIANRLNATSNVNLGPNLAVATQYFLVNSKVRLNRASLEAQTLMQRVNQTTRIVWIREN